MPTIPMKKYGSRRVIIPIKNDMAWSKYGSVSYDMIGIGAMY